MEMNAIELKLDANKRGAFVIEDGENRIAEMVVAVSGENLIVYHTQVSDELKGKGVATKLLETMVAYARKNKIKVVALCPYVSAQFQRHPDKYADIWNQQWRE
jgi:predicted GNAT family acetyltransferase